MIVLFTDFGHQGPYMGQMTIRCQQVAPDTPVVTLMADAPTFNPRASAYLLAALVKALPENCVVLGVVDPGVGDDARKPVWVKSGGRIFVGPDNGLFAIAAQNNGEWFEISWRPPALSNSFHGRDLFAPVAAMLSQGEIPASNPLDAWVGQDWPTEVDEVIYIDAYGNLMTGIPAERMSQRDQLVINGESVAYASTFSAVRCNELFWYENSSGLVEIAVNQGNARQHLGASIGTLVTSD